MTNWFGCEECHPEFHYGPGQAMTLTPFEEKCPFSEYDRHRRNAPREKYDSEQGVFT